MQAETQTDTNRPRQNGETRKVDTNRLHSHIKRKAIHCQLYTLNSEHLHGGAYVFILSDRAGRRLRHKSRKGDKYANHNNGRDQR